MTVVVKGLCYTICGAALAVGCAFASDIPAHDGIYQAGVPDCVELTDELLTDALRARILKIYDTEPAGRGLRETTQGGRMLTLSHCGSFIVVTPFWPAGPRGNTVVWLGTFPTLILFHVEFAPPEYWPYAISNGMLDLGPDPDTNASRL